MMKYEVKIDLRKWVNEEVNRIINYVEENHKPDVDKYNEFISDVCDVYKKHFLNERNS